MISVAYTFPRPLLPFMDKTERSLGATVTFNMFASDTGSPNNLANFSRPLAPKRRRERTANPMDLDSYCRLFLSVGWCTSGDFTMTRLYGIPQGSHRISDINLRSHCSSRLERSNFHWQGCICSSCVSWKRFSRKPFGCVSHELDGRVLRFQAYSRSWGCLTSLRIVLRLELGYPKHAWGCQCSA